MENWTLNESVGAQHGNRFLAVSYCALNRQRLGAAVGEIVNLKRFRKRAEREQSQLQASANRARFGRTKSERASDAKSAKRAKEVLDQHRINGEDPS